MSHDPTPNVDLSREPAAAAPATLTSMASIPHVVPVGAVVPMVFAPTESVCVNSPQTKPVAPACPLVIVAFVVAVREVVFDVSAPDISAIEFAAAVMDSDAAPDAPVPQT